MCSRSEVLLGKQTLCMISGLTYAFSMLFMCMKFREMIWIASCSFVPLNGKWRSIVTSSERMSLLKSKNRNDIPTSYFCSSFSGQFLTNQTRPKRQDPVIYLIADEISEVLLHFPPSHSTQLKRWLIKCLHASDLVWDSTRLRVMEPTISSTLD